MTNEEVLAASEKRIAELAKRMVPITDEQIARHLGISELSVGAGRVVEAPGAKNWRVLAWWVATVEPSFSPKLAIGAIHEEEWIGGPTAERVVVRGFVVDSTGGATSRLDADPIPEALGRLNPFRVEPAHRARLISFGCDEANERSQWVEMSTCDGLGYSFRWETKVLSNGRFRFSNPEGGWPLEFERVLFRFARQVVTVAVSPLFDDQLACWLGYREEIGEPHDATKGPESI